MTPADDKIRECIEQGRSFLLDAGAGSGKTGSLVRALNLIRSERRTALIRNAQKVACITFTNVAKDEIGERTEHDPLFVVSTIHDFLWSTIKPFQKELRQALQELNERLPPRSRRKVESAELATALAGNIRITYSDRGARFLEGRIFHDDLLEIASLMFAAHPLLAKALAARYPIIFVDEYQDTNPLVISILLSHVMATARPPVIGFFGDKMQSIYSDGVGEIAPELRAGLEEIRKEENYRCARSVIRVLNRIRTDIEQKPAGENVEGTAVYISLAGAGPDDDIVGKARAIAIEKFGWGEDCAPKTLFLTHRLIARRAGYEDLWRCYSDRGGFYRDRFQAGEDELAGFLVRRLEPLLAAWRQGRAGRVIALLNEVGSLLAGATEKSRTKDALNDLDARAGGAATIRDVASFVRESGLMPLPDVLDRWLDQEPSDAEEAEKAFFSAFLAVPYAQVAAYNGILLNNLPYSTKHGVKGDEFDTVLVVLDDQGAGWNQYSFENMLSGADTSEQRLRRTRNLFYVSCSRAKRNLAVIDLGDPGRKKQAVETLFGAESCAW